MRKCSKKILIFNIDMYQYILCILRFACQHALQNFVSRFINFSYYM